MWESITPIFTRTSKFAFEISVLGASRIIQFAFNNESIGGHFPLLDSHSRLLHFKNSCFYVFLLTHLDDIIQDVFDDTSFVCLQQAENNSFCNTMNLHTYLKVLLRIICGKVARFSSHPKFRGDLQIWRENTNQHLNMFVTILWTALEL